MRTASYSVTICTVIALVLGLSLVAEAAQMSSSDINISYGDDGSAKIKVKNNLALSTLHVQIYYGTPGCYNYGSINLNISAGGRSGRWSSWTMYMPRPIDVIATGEGRQWTYQID